MSGPPFDRYPVTSADIRARADTIANASKPLVAVKDAMDGPREEAAEAVDGDLDGGIEGPVDPTQKQAMSTADGTELCGGAIDLYANYVDLFNRSVDDLNARWNSAVERDFDVPRSGKSEEEHDTAVAEERGALAKQLRKEFGEGELALDEGAEDVARVLNAGPEEGAPMLAAYTGATTLALVLGGVLGSGRPLTLEDIQRKYQVEDDPNGMVNLPGVGHVTASEA